MSEYNIINHIVRLSEVTEDLCQKYTSLEKKGYLTQDNFKNEEIKIIE